MRALAAAGKYFSTYSWPSASPIDPLTACTPRFHRWRCASCPLNVLPKNSNRASTNGWLRNGPDDVMYWAASHAFQVAIGTVGTIAAKPLKNDGWLMIMSGVLSRPCAVAQPIQSNPGMSTGSFAVATLL